MIYGRYFDLPRAVIRERAEELLEFVQLTDRRDSKVDPLSGGMKRRLTIARALINQPELLLLDEPTTGLDPQARHLVWERLYRLKQTGVTLVLTTHYMDEAEQLCDRLVIMDGGRIVAEGSPRELIDRARDARGRRGALRRPTPTRPRRCRSSSRWPIASSRSPIASCCTPTTATAPRRRSTTTACAPRRCSCAGPASKTCSSSSPAARSRRAERRTARVGRARPTPPILRVVEREWQVYRRLWRGLAFSTFLSPVLFLAAMGLGLGEPRRREQSGTVDGVSYLDFVAPGLLGRERGAARRRRVDVAGARRREVDALLPRHGRDADHGRATSSAGFVIWTAIRTMFGAAVFLVVAALLGAIPSPWGVLAIPAAGADRGRVLRAARARSRSTQETDCLVPGDHAARRSCRCSCSRARSSRSRSCRTGSSRSRCCRRCGTASSSPGRATTGDFDALADRRRTSRSSSRVVAAGWFVGRAHVHAAAGGDDRDPHRAARASSSATCSRTGACGSSSSPASSSRCCSCSRSASASASSSATSQVGGDVGHLRRVRRARAARDRRR